MTCPAWLSERNACFVAPRQVRSQRQHEVQLDIKKLVSSSREASHSPQQQLQPITTGVEQMEGASSWARRAPLRAESTAAARSRWTRQVRRSMISTAVSKVGGAMRSITVLGPFRRFASSSLSVTLHPSHTLSSLRYQWGSSDSLLFSEGSSTQQEAYFPSTISAHFSSAAGSIMAI